MRLLRAVSAVRVAARAARRDTPLRAARGPIRHRAPVPASGAVGDRLGALVRARHRVLARAPSLALERRSARRALPRWPLGTPRVVRRARPPPAPRRRLRLDRPPPP